MEKYNYLSDLAFKGQMPLTIHSMPASDFFNSSTKSKQDGAFEYINVTGNFTLKATVSAELLSLYDAGGLMLYENENRWAKLVIEKTAHNKINVVSMFTNTYSDDVIGESVSGDDITLKVSYQEGFIEFTYILEGQNARKHRKGFLNLGKVKKVGFISQSPKGSGTEVKVSNIVYEKSK